MSQKSKKDDYKWFWAKLDRYTQQHGLRHSKMREEIIQHFLDTGGHFDAKGLHASLSAKSIHAGAATIFRTLKLLHEAGLVESSSLKGDAAAQFELIVPQEHHDHFVCEVCGLVVEFHDKALELMKHKVARKYDFELQSHQLVLYGKCKKCR